MIGQGMKRWYMVQQNLDFATSPNNLCLIYCITTIRYETPSLIIAEQRFTLTGHFNVPLEEETTRKYFNTLIQSVIGEILSKCVPATPASLLAANIILRLLELKI